MMRKTVVDEAKFSIFRILFDWIQFVISANLAEHVNHMQI